MNGWGHHSRLVGLDGGMNLGVSVLRGAVEFLFRYNEALWPLPARLKRHRVVVVSLASGLVPGLHPELGDRLLFCHPSLKREGGGRGRGRAGEGVRGSVRINI